MTASIARKSNFKPRSNDIWALVTRANQYVDQTAPFKLAKDPAQAQRLDEVLYNLAETCRVLAVLLAPFLPGTAAKIYAQLGLGAVPRTICCGELGRVEKRPYHRRTGAAFPAQRLSQAAT